MKWKATKDGAAAQITLTGRLDESAKQELFGLRTELAGVEKAEFDVGGLTLINSLGMSHWLRFMQDLSGHTKPSFVRCGSVFLDYAMMTRSMGAPFIASFLAPYFCTSCGREEEHLTTRAEAAKALVTKPCPDCTKGHMQPQLVLEEIVEYFANLGD